MTIFYVLCQLCNKEMEMVEVSGDYPTTRVNEVWKCALGHTLRIGETKP